MEAGPPEPRRAAGALLRDRAVWLLLAAALALRLGVFLLAAGHPERRLRPDSRHYLDLARTLGSAGRFAREPDGPAEVFRVPGYPLFLVPFAAAAARPEPWVALAQIVLDLGTVLLVAALALRFLPRREALLAGWLYALSLAAASAANLVLSEVLFTLMLVGAAALAAAAARPRGKTCVSPWLWAAAGALLGLAALVRAVALPLMAPLAALALWRGGVERRARLLACAACLTAFAVPTAGWAARNRRAGAGWRLSTAAAHNLLLYDAAGLQARREGRPVAEVRGELGGLAAERAAAVGGGPGALAAAQRRLALEILAASPGRAAAGWLRGGAACLLPAAGEMLELAGAVRGGRGTLDVLGQEGFPAAVRHYFRGAPAGAALTAAPFVLVLAATYVLAAAGLARLVRERRLLPAALLLAPVLLLLLIPGAAGHPRFRAPAMPLLCWLAAAGWPLVISKLKRAPSP